MLNDWYCDMTYDFSDYSNDLELADVTCSLAEDMVIFEEVETEVQLVPASIPSEQLCMPNSRICSLASMKSVIPYQLSGSSNTH